MTGSPFFDGPFLAIPKWARTKITQSQKLAALQVLSTLIEHMNIRTKKVTLSISEIATDSLLSKETVKRMLKWLLDEGIIETLRKEGKTNEYLIKYSDTRVTHDPSVGSSMTLVVAKMEQTRVTHDPSLMPKNEHLSGEMLFHNRILINSSIDNHREVVCDDPKGSNMILGGEPEDTTGTTKVESKNRKNKEIEILVNRFIYSKPFCMRSFNTRELTVLRRACKLMLQSGLSSETISDMIDSFVYDSRFQQYDNITNAFASKKVQAVLLDRVSVSITTQDPIIQFMVNDFVRPEGIILPWPTTNDEHLRKIVLARCLEGLYRYPDLVAIIVAHWNGDFQNAGLLSSLSALESLIKAGLGKETVDTQTLLSALSFVNIPQSLVSGTPRASAGNLAKAAYDTRRGNLV